MEVEYWRNRATQAEKAADTMGKCLGELMPHVDHKHTLAYTTYHRWLAFKDARLEADRAMIQQSEIPTTGGTSNNVASLPGS